MGDTIRKYLDTRAVHKQWPLEGSYPSDDINIVVVIPALAESNYLFQTLAALAVSSHGPAERTLVICVINNRAENAVDSARIADNQLTLRLLDRCVREEVYDPLCLAWVDASSPGRELPQQGGVGLARKIGLDHGLALIDAWSRPFAPLVCLDADSPPEPGYLDTLRAFYTAEKRWAGYVAYAHDLEGGEQDREAVIAYEIYMRYHELNLRWAGSPYAYPALGSIVSCTAGAYAAAGGMNRRCAAEDFYFMQQLAKTGTLTPIPGTLVRPSGRRSDRTPFGTGRRITSPEVLKNLYHPESYRILKDWLVVIAEYGSEPAEVLLCRARDLAQEWAVFLERRGFAGVWDRLRLQNRDSQRLQHHFHLWFDGLRTIQWIHHFRDAGHPDLPAREALDILHDRTACLNSLQDGCSENVLQALRRACSE